MFVSLGEIFDLIIYAVDQNGNIQDGVYLYYANLITSPSNVLCIHLDTDDILTTAFGAVRNVTTQRTTLVMHNSYQLQSNCQVNYKNSFTFPIKFSLNLTDSSNGIMVCMLFTKITCSYLCKCLHM